MSILFKQRDGSDCGAACVTAVAAYFKVKISISHARELAMTDQKGTTVHGLVKALSCIGFDAKGVKGEMASLPKIPKPAIAHVVIRSTFHHFVVITSVTESFVKIMDPVDGEIHSYSHQKFEQIWKGILVIMLPRGKFDTKNKLSNNRRLFNLTKPYLLKLGVASLCSLFYTLTGLTLSIYVQQIIDVVLPFGDKNFMHIMTLGMLVCLGLQGICSIIKSKITLSVGVSLDHNLIIGYFRHILVLPQTFFDSMKTGEIISRINDAVKIRTLINEAVSSIAVNIFILVFSFALMFTLYWKLAMLMALILPVYSAIYLLTNFLNKKSERRLMEESAVVENQLVESLTSTTTMKAFSLEHFALSKFENKFSQLLTTIRLSGLNSIFTAVSTEVVSRLFTILLLWSGTFLVLHGEITTGELLSFFTLLAYFTTPASSLIGLNKTIQNAVISADRLFDVMELETEQAESSDELNESEAQEIVFQNVNFRYGMRENALTNLSIEIRPGQITAIAGESGSGKSTVVALLQKLYAPQSGAILINGQDLARVAASAVRKHISVVPQKIELFGESIMENIAVGELQPDESRVKLICEKLGILEFIESLPAGFSTELGENGASISGGQRQRLAVARALYKQHQILILDEATSALDSGAEHYIRDVLEMLREEGKTIIIIAHRLSSLVLADKILVLKDGQLAESGTHEQLLRQNGAYFHLWKEQFPILESWQG